MATAETHWPEWVNISDKGDLFEYTGETDPTYAVPVSGPTCTVPPMAGLLFCDLSTM